MASLAEAYEGRVGEVQNVERLYLGTTLFLVGAVLAAVGTVVAATDLLAGFGASEFDSRLVAGVLGGVGVPTVVLGVFTVLPAKTRIRAAAAIGASITALGVALFWYAYPSHWAGYGKDLTLAVTAVYLLGTLTLIGCLFAGITTFKRRNDPGGTVRMEVTKQGETKVVEVERSRLQNGFGSVGMFGETPDGEVETQTNRPGSGTAGTGTSADGRPQSSGGRSSGGSRSSTSSSSTTRDRAISRARSAASDGGSTTRDITSPMDDPSSGGERSASASGPGRSQLADTYCGNCEHFQYVRNGQGMQPYCGYYGERMDDMEACDAWEPNS